MPGDTRRPTAPRTRDRPGPQRALGWARPDGGTPPGPVPFRRAREQQFAISTGSQDDVNPAVVPLRRAARGPSDGTCSASALASPPPAARRSRASQPTAQRRPTGRHLPRLDHAPPMPRRLSRAWTRAAAAATVAFRAEVVPYYRAESRSSGGQPCRGSVVRLEARCRGRDRETPCGSDLEKDDHDLAGSTFPERRWPRPR